jgi:FlaA1/EpsC-like NDP-sugar epimerase
LPLLTAGIASIVSILLSLVFRAAPLFASCLGLAAAIPVALVGGRRFARRLEISDSALDALRAGSEDSEQIVYGIVSSAEKIHRILSDDAKRNIVFVGELRDSVYRNSAIAGETRILEKVVDDLSAKVGRSTEGVDGIARRSTS